MPQFIQIAIESHTYAEGTQTVREATLYALADDGSVWYTAGDTPSDTAFAATPWIGMRLPTHVQKREV